MWPASPIAVGSDDPNSNLGQFSPGQFRSELVEPSVVRLAQVDVGASCWRQQRQAGGSSVRQPKILRRGISPGWIVSDQPDQRSVSPCQNEGSSGECVWVEQKWTCGCDRGIANPTRAEASLSIYYITSSGFAATNIAGWMFRQDDGVPHRVAARQVAVSQLRLGERDVPGEPGAGVPQSADQSEADAGVPRSGPCALREVRGAPSGAGPVQGRKATVHPRVRVLRPRTDSPHDDQGRGQPPGVGWDLVKGLKKEHLERQFRQPKLRYLKRLAIDEIHVGRGYQFRTLMLDLDTEAIVFVGTGPFLELTRGPKRCNRSEIG